MKLQDKDQSETGLIEGFEWKTFDLEENEEMQKVIKFLNNNSN